MDRISAAGNLIIEMSVDRWSLLANSGGQERLLVEASVGQPMHYNELFASKRKLPSDGTLPPDSIQCVVLGYSYDDDSWHLGLLFAGDLVMQRGSRWCEMASWPDPDPTVFREPATHAGHALARAVGSPFNLIEPEPPAAEPPDLPPPPPLRDLPLSFEEWTLAQDEGSELRFTRASSWMYGKQVRIAWYTLLIVAYVGMAVLSLQGTLAMTKPDFLPLVGFGVAVLLLVMIVMLIGQLLRAHRVIAVDAAGVAALRGASERWRVEQREIEALYVSEVVNRKGKKRTVYHSELNLYMKDGTFRLLLNQPHPVELKQPPEADVQDGVVPLTAYIAQSDLQMAALHIAKVLDVEVRYDRRLK